MYPCCYLALVKCWLTAVKHLWEQLWEQKLQFPTSSKSQVPANSVSLVPCPTLNKSSCGTSFGTSCPSRARVPLSLFARICCDPVIWHWYPSCLTHDSESQSHAVAYPGSAPY